MCHWKLATLCHTLSVHDSHQLHLTRALLAPSNSVTIREGIGGGSCAAAPGPSHKQAAQREACHASLHFFSLFIYESLKRVPLSSLPPRPRPTAAAAACTESACVVQDGHMNTTVFVLYAEIKTQTCVIFFR